MLKLDPYFALSPDDDLHVSIGFVWLQVNYRFQLQSFNEGKVQFVKEATAIDTFIYYSKVKRRYIKNCRHSFFSLLLDFFLISGVQEGGKKA